MDVLRAVFDKSAATSGWTVGAPLLKAFSEYFGTKTEHLDAYCDAGKMFFTSYTEKVVKGKGTASVSIFLIIASL